LSWLPLCRVLLKFLRAQYGNIAQEHDQGYQRVMWPTRFNPLPKLNAPLACSLVRLILMGWGMPGHSYFMPEYWSYKTGLIYLEIDNQKKMT
jgi:hypothetical protein